MRVLMVNDATEAGGAEAVVEQTAAVLRAAGHEVSLFTAADTTALRWYLPWRYVHCRPAARALGRRLREFSPDVVHFHNVYHCLSPAVLAVPHAHGVPAVLTAHDQHLRCPSPVGIAWRARRPHVVEPDSTLTVGEIFRWRWDQQRHRSVARRLQWMYGYRLRRFQAGIDLILCPGGFAAPAFARIRPTQILPNPLPGSEFVDLTRPASTTDSPGRYLFVGRVTADKGLVEFIDVAPLWLLDRLTVVGDGPALEAARHVATDRSAGVTFLGRLDRTEVAKTMHGHDILVVPSRVPEMDPLVVVEASMAGLRILGSELGGVGDIVRRVGGGELFDPFDPDSIVAAAERSRTPAAPPDARRLLADRHPTRYLAELERVYRSVTGAAGVP